jgi:Mn-containing catalase
MSIHAESTPSEEKRTDAGTVNRSASGYSACGKQLLKALPPKWQGPLERSNSRLCWRHLPEAEAQVARLNECLELLGGSERAKPYKDMAGSCRGSEEVISEGKDKDDASADLALIGAAQRIEHYEIAAYDGP